MLQDFIKRCENYYKMILVSEFDSKITGNFVKYYKDIVESFNNRILTSKDYKSKRDIKLFFLPLNVLKSQLLSISLTLSIYTNQAVVFGRPINFIV